MQPSAFAKSSAKKTYCRICTAYCGLLVEVDESNGQYLSVKRGPSDPMSRGDTCIKERQVDHQADGPQRLSESVQVPKTIEPPTSVRWIGVQSN
jgi:anaerobic selenocysteine-containing dehydrogenase